jgi:hypothetical protein
MRKTDCQGPDADLVEVAHLLGADFLLAEDDRQFKFWMAVFATPRRSA